MKVQPRSSSNRVDGKIGDAFKVRLTAPPADGKANQACVRLLAERLGVASAAVRIVSGATSRQKVIEIAGLDAASVEARLLA